MKATFLFLGTGASIGVPVIGCKCATCTSLSPYNKRLRSSGLITLGDKKLLIDVGPDFRQQALRFQIDTIDGLLLTHTHYDHIAGIDELRVYYFRSKLPIPCLLSKESHSELQKRYPYLLEKNAEGQTSSAQFAFQILENDFGPIEFQGVSLSVLTYSQGGIKVTGYRLGDFAYVSDIRSFDEKRVFNALSGVKYLVVSALRDEPSPLQFSLSEAIEFAKMVGAEKTWLTHLSHTLEHFKTDSRLPAGIQTGYDGLEFGFSAQ